MSSRFVILSKPEALPGECLICKVPDREYYIDVGVSMEFHGVVYICSVCLTEMAEQCEFLSPDSTLKLKAKLGQLEDDVFALTKREGGLESAIDGLVSAGYSREPVAHSNPGSGSVSEISSKRTHETESELGSGTGTSDEQSNDKGMAELPDDAKRDAGEFSLNI